MLEGNPSETLAKIMSLSAEDTITEQWNAQIMLEVMLRHEIILVTQYCDHELIRSMGLTPTLTIEEAIAMALRKKGNMATITVIPDGASVIVDTRS